MDMANEIDSEMEGGNPQEVLVLPTELFPYEGLGVSFNPGEEVEPMSETFHYDEWDYQVQLARPDLPTIIERRQRRADLEVMEQILEWRVYSGRTTIRSSITSNACRNVYHAFFRL